MAHVRCHARTTNVNDNTWRTYGKKHQMRVNSVVNFYCHLSSWLPAVRIRAKRRPTYGSHYYVRPSAHFFFRETRIMARNHGHMCSPVIAFVADDPYVGRFQNYCSACHVQSHVRNAHVVLLLQEQRVRYTHVYALFFCLLRTDTTPAMAV